MKRIFNIRGLLCIFAIAFITGVIVWSFFEGFGINKLISFSVSFLLLCCAFAVFPIYAAVTKEDITIVYIFGIKRQARWNTIETIVKTKGLYKDYFIYPMVTGKGKKTKVDFPVSRKLTRAIEENWWGKISL